MPGVSGNGPSNNIRGEVFLSKGIALAVDQVAKLRGRELAQAPPGFNVLGDCGNGAEQDTAAWIWMSSGWFGLVNLTIVLACKNNLSSRRDESKTYLLRVKLKRLNRAKLVRVLTRSHMLRNLHNMRLQHGLILGVNPTHFTIKILPRIGLVIPSKFMVMQGLGPQTPDITLLALKKATILTGYDLFPVHGRLLLDMEPECGFVDIHSLVA